ncbi:MAG: hypothetical protein ABIH09_01530 [Candidatus Omnitrophota bacterium]
MKITVNKSLLIMLLVSLTVHVLGMSMVTIIMPQDMDRLKAYTRVDFLGAVFQKTAFDIMLESTDAFYKGDVCSQIIQPQYMEYLRTHIRKQKPESKELPANLEDKMDGTVENFLKGDKIVPKIFTNIETSTFVDRDALLRGKMRTIVYSPEKYFIRYGLYGNKKSFKVKFKALLGEDGDIKTTELITTTGYPQVDMTASKLLRESMFKSSESIIGKNEWCEIEVILKTGR